MVVQKVPRAMIRIVIEDNVGIYGAGLPTPYTVTALVPIVTIFLIMNTVLVCIMALNRQHRPNITVPIVAPTLLVDDSHPRPRYNGTVSTQDPDLTVLTHHYLPLIVVWRHGHH